MSLEEILMADDVVSSIRDHKNELFSMIPELKVCDGFDQKHPHHHLDVFEHTLLALSFSPKDFEIRLVLLLHDIGKPFSFYEEDGVRHFPNHAEKSMMIAKSILDRFHYTESFKKEVLYLICEHDTEIKSEELLYDYELSYKKYTVQRCDALAHHPEKLEKRKQYLEYTKQLFKK